KCLGPRGWCRLRRAWRWPASASAGFPNHINTGVRPCSPPPSGYAPCRHSTAHSRPESDYAMTILERFRIDDRVAVVTGASSGLGVAFAQALAEAGANVVLGARRIDRLEDTRALVETAGRRAIAVRTDVTEPHDCQALVRAAMDEFGRVDILVNNAGVG